MSASVANNFEKAENIADLSTSQRLGFSHHDNYWYNHQSENIVPTRFQGTEKVVKDISNLSILRNKNLKSAIEDRKNMSFTESTIIATHENNFKILRKGKVKISEIRKVVKDEN